MTEPNAGSDLGGIATRAEKVDGGYRLNGQKMWVTSAPVADFFTVFARTGKDKLLTIFLVERDFEGLNVGRAIDKMGVWALPTSELSLSDCFVPNSHRLSKEEGDGQAHLRQLLAEIRVVTGAMALGGGRAALEEAVRYAAQRKQFGKPINRFQAIQLKLAEMATDMEAAERLVLYAAWLKDNDKPHHKEAAMAKLYCSEVMYRCANHAVQLHGGYGLMKDYDVERFYRDQKLLEIGEGTSEIQRIVIARHIGARCL